MSNRGASRRVTVTRAGGYWHGRFEAMACPCEVLSEAANAGEARKLTRLAATEAWRIEDKFSRYLAGNVVDRINSAAGKPVEVDPETAELIDFATTLHRLSDGRFDISSGALRRAWTFDGSDRIPAQGAIAAALRAVGWHRVSWSPPVLRLPADMEIDFGGVGKEYAVDRAVAILREKSDVSCLVNFGGDLAVTSAPNSRRAWTVGIEPPGDVPTRPSARLSLTAGALATSGDTRRFLIRDGVRYGHILDPTTGWPVPCTPRSVTVAADTCTQAGMLSTLAMLEGQGAEAFLAAQGVRYWCLRDARDSSGRLASTG
jgi:thiamine biosynthesis lipoprotein